MTPSETLKATPPPASPPGAEPALTRRTRKVTQLAVEVPVTEGRLPEPEVRAAEECPSIHYLGGRPVSEREWERYKAWLKEADEIVRIEQRTMYESE